jgi:hypothetical protein
MDNIGRQAGGLPMKSHKGWKLLSHLYDTVEMALWSFGIALLIFLAVFVIPMIPAHQREYQRIRAQEIANENELYCEKLNIKAGTQAYTECLLVLGAFRLKVEQRIYRESEAF